MTDDFVADDFTPDTPPSRPDDFQPDEPGVLSQVLSPIWGAGKEAFLGGGQRMAHPSRWYDPVLGAAETLGSPFAVLSEAFASPARAAKGAVPELPRQALETALRLYPDLAFGAEGVLGGLRALQRLPATYRAWRTGKVLPAPPPTPKKGPEQLTLPLRREVPIAPPGKPSPVAGPPLPFSPREATLAPEKLWERGGVYRPHPRAEGPFPYVQRELPLTETQAYTPDGDVIPGNRPVPPAVTPEDYARRGINVEEEKGPAYKPGEKKVKALSGVVSTFDEEAARKIAEKTYAAGKIREVEASQGYRRLKKLIPWRELESAAYAIEGDEGAYATLSDPAKVAVKWYHEQMNEVAAKIVSEGLLDEESLVDNYLSHRILGKGKIKQEAIRAYWSHWRDVAKQGFLRTRRLPTIDQLEAWLEHEGWAARGLTVDKNPATIYAGYMESVGRAERANMLLRSIAGSTVKGTNKPVVIKFDGPGPPVGYVEFKHPKLSALASGEGSSVAIWEPYGKSLAGFLERPYGNAWSQAWDRINTVHRAFAMMLPWQHLIFNVGSDAMWLTGFKARRAWKLGQELMNIQEGGRLEPFAVDMIMNGLDPPTRSHTITDIPRQLSEVMREAPSMTGLKHVAPLFEKLEQVTWEKGVAPLMVGVSRVLYDSFEAGKIPLRIRRLGITPQAWEAMPYESKLRSIARIVNLSAGQLPRHMFNNPDLIDGLRMWMFSPRWNASNVGMIQAAYQNVFTKRVPWTLRGLNPQEQAVVKGMMRAYLDRSLGISFILQNVANKWVTSLLLGGEGYYMWQNPEGYRTRVFGGWDATGRARWVLPFTSYFLKDVGNAVESMAALRTGDAGPLISHVSTKLAGVPRMFGTVFYGDPYANPLSKLPGRSLGQHALDALEESLNQMGMGRFVSAGSLASGGEKARKDPWGTAAQIPGLSVSHTPTAETAVAMAKGQQNRFRSIAGHAQDPATTARAEDQGPRALQEALDKASQFLRFSRPSPPIPWRQ